MLPYSLGSGSGRSLSILPWVRPLFLPLAHQLASQFSLVVPPLALTNLPTHHIGPIGFDWILAAPDPGLPSRLTDYLRPGLH